MSSNANKIEINETVRDNAAKEFATLLGSIKSYTSLDSCYYYEVFRTNFELILPLIEIRNQTSNETLYSLLKEYGYENNVNLEKIKKDMQANPEEFIKHFKVLENIPNKEKNPNLALSWCLFCSGIIMMCSVFFLLTGFLFVLESFKQNKTSEHKKPKAFIEFEKEVKKQQPSCLQTAYNLFFSSPKRQEKPQPSTTWLPSDMLYYFPT